MITVASTSERRRANSRRGARAGFTLVELVLAAGLLMVLMIGVFALLDGSLSLWRRSETRRNLTEQATGVVSLLSHDLRSLESGGRGDVLLEWVKYDTDGDGLREMVWPRLRFIRQASRAELLRMLPPIPVAEAQAPKDKDAQSLQVKSGEADESEGALPLANPDISGPGLIEVCWAVVPMSTKDVDRRSEGLIYRGARKLNDGGESFFDSNFIRSGGLPQTNELDEVSAGLLWFQPLFATQTSIIHSGWDPGVEPHQSATSWDFWREDRPDTTMHHWNQPSRMMPSVKDRGILPRRIRVELEFEREADHKRRARTTEQIELTDVTLQVTDGRRLPQSGAFIKLEGEWMEVTRVDGDRVSVKRGQRGTQAIVHGRGVLVHWGLPLVREIPVALYREDWDL
jgi:hypothetical protein